MNFKSLISNMINNRKNNFREKMKKQNKCPECRGQGFIIPSSMYITSSLECHACNSTGRYTDWEKRNNDDY
ncbi:DnaJ-class molecular chaperone [Metabacillus crassostreae]|nr:DnaJ-class molecular chaperone [Metabacillus crassostreae]